MARRITSRTDQRNELARLKKALALHREEARHQAERWLEVNSELEASLALFKGLYEDAPVGYLTLSPSGIVIDANIKATRLLGREPNRIRGHPLLFFVDPGHTNTILTHLSRCRSGDAAVVSELIIRTAERKTIPVELVSRRNWLGGRMAYQTVISDLSERRANERALGTSEKRYREIVETANEGICIVDSSNCVTFVNRAFVRLIGCAQDELVSRPLEDLLPVEDADAERLAFARREIGRLGVREQRLRRADGSAVWTSVSTTLLLDDDGGFAGMLRMYTDITDRKALETAREDLVRHLVRAQEGERQRVARELHDQMGQHLVGLSLGLNRLSQLGSGSVEIGQITQRLQSLTDIMARDVQHLALELRPASLDDLGLADAVSNYAERMARSFGIEVDVQCDRVSRLDTAAETTVFRVVQEALTNVAKHATARRVSVILEPRGNTLQAIVEDDGVGFRPEYVLRQGKDGDRLGLRGMIERAALVGGDLQIESRPGRGTTVFLRVPLQAAERGSHEEATTAAG